MRRSVYFLLIIFAIRAAAQAPAGYYSEAEGKTDAALKTALHKVTEGPSVTSYSGLWTAFKKTDIRTDGKVWDIYSNTTNYTFGTDQCGNYSGEGDCYNREHSFPKSWFSDASPMYSDLYHLYPSDGYTNGRRSNYPFGEVGSISWSSNNQFSKLGASISPGYSGTVFEPNDIYKGDLARTYFYMVTAYENRISSWNSPHLNGTRYPAFNNWSIDLLLKWHRQDPVSQKEIDRNNAVNYGHQSNRNPFIDYPELAEHIWGNKKGVVWTAATSTEPMLIYPKNGSVIDIGDIPYQQETTFSVEIRAANLTGDLSISLSGYNVFYTLPTDKISKTDAEKGYTLNITINPPNVGSQDAMLNISGGGISASSIQLTANSTSEFLALPATNITGDSFTANWTTSDGALSYLLNVYQYENGGAAAITLLEENFDTGEVPDGWTKAGYVDHFEPNSIRLASGKDLGSITTPELNLSAPTAVSVTAKSWSGDNSDLLVHVDDVLFSTMTLTNTFEEYVIELPAFTQNSKIKFLANKSKRLFIDSVAIATEGISEKIVSLDGFPKNVGTQLNFQVDALMPESTYFYTVTPQGNGAAVSNEIQVKTTEPTKIADDDEYREITIYPVGKTLYINNAEPGSKLSVYSILGSKILEYPINNDQISIDFSYNGIFIVQVSKGNLIVGTKKIIVQ